MTYVPPLGAEGAVPDGVRSSVSRDLRTEHLTVTVRRSLTVGQLKAIVSDLPLTFGQTLNKISVAISQTITPPRAMRGSLGSARLGAARKQKEEG